MAYPFTQVVISYGSSSSATLAIPAGCSFDAFVRTLIKNGFWLAQNLSTSQPASATFVPASQITSITAQ